MIASSLITADDLVPHLGDPDWIIIDCRFDLTQPDAGRAAYAVGHLPQARYADLNRDLSAPVTKHTGRHPLPDPYLLAQRFGAWGIHADTYVVAYDDSAGMFAARLWWLLRWLGHQRVAVLDGGWKQWNAQSLPLSNEIPQPTPVTFVPHTQDHWVDTQTVMQRLNDPRYALVDVRAAERFSGKAEPIDPIAGHIPGAHNIPSSNNVDTQGRFKSASALHALYTQRLSHLTPQQLTIMCGSGVTACHTLLALDIAGLHGAQLYAGSWSEWITDTTRPRAHGL